MSASLRLAEIALHDLCSCPGLSSQLLSRGAPALVAADAQAAGPSATPGSLAVRSPVLQLQYRSTPAEIAEAVEQTGEPQPQMDVLVQPLLLRLRLLCLQRLLAFDPAQALAASRLPCLVLQGAADRQVVPMEDVQPLIDALGKRDAPGEAVIIPAASHNLKVAQWPTDAGFSGPIAPAPEATSGVPSGESIPQPAEPAESPAP